MCSVCCMSPCHPRCPNADEPKAIYKCSFCEESIVEGDEYYELDGEYYHDECFEDNALEFIIEKLGVTKRTAEVEEWE